MTLSHSICDAARQTLLVASFRRQPFHSSSRGLWGTIPQGDGMKPATMYKSLSAERSAYRMVRNAGRLNLKAGLMNLAIRDMLLVVSNRMLWRSGDATETRPLVMVELLLHRPADAEPMIAALKEAGSCIIRGPDDLKLEVETARAGDDNDITITGSWA